MRKRLLSIGLAILVMLFSACKKSDNVIDSVTITTEAANTTVTAETTNFLDANTVYDPSEDNKPEAVELSPNEDYNTDGDAEYKRSFRVIYYRIPNELIDLVGQDGYNYIESKMSGFAGSNPPFMLIANFVEHFKIPKDQFVDLFSVMKESWIESGCDISSEEYELPNADIIYTFDNEIIDAYYRRDNPVAPDWMQH